MRKTLLAVGLAVLVSMMLAPHGGKQGIEGWGPFFSDYGFSARDFAFWHIGRVMIDMLALEIVFFAVLLAVIANINWRRWKSRRDALKKIAVFFFIFAFLACACLWLWHDQDQRRRRAEYVARQEAIDAQRKREPAAATFPRATAATIDSSGLPDQNAGNNPFDKFDEVVMPGKYASTDPNAGIDPEQWKIEEEWCHKEIQLHKWDHQTTIGKTFMIGVLRERRLGDRKADVDAVAKQIGARFYRTWEHHKLGNGQCIAQIIDELRMNAAQ